MPFARRHNKPVVVEVRPEDVAPSNMSPSSPAKAVRFPVQYDIVAGVSRPLTQSEAWSLYHFEKHARTCRQCRSPYDTILSGGELCESGHDLAQDVAMHVYHRNGQIYSTRKEGLRDIRVEVPHGYDSLLALLKARDRLKRKPRVVPIISYEPRTLPKTYTTAPAVQAMEPSYTYADAYTHVRRSESHSPRRRQTHYSTIVVGDDDEYERPRSSSKEEKRGSLYRDEPRRKEYRVEVREPSDRRRQKDRGSRYLD